MKRIYRICIIISLFLLFGTQLAAAKIYIPQDTSVGTWNPVTRMYTLTTDIVENDIEISDDNLTLDGDGHTVTGTRIMSDLGAIAAPAKPSKFALLQNYPNSLNPDTWIPYQLAQDADVTIRIYNVSGRLIRTLSLGHQPAGFYVDKSRAAYWDGRNETGEYVANGMYFYTIRAGDFVATKKMAVAR